jgi:pyruvate,water dikinase
MESESNRERPTPEPIDQDRSETHVVQLERLGAADLATVGGKNASLGELIRHLTRAGVRVPGGFATTAHAYREFLAQNHLVPAIRRHLASWQDGTMALAAAGEAIRDLILSGEWPAEIAEAIRRAYRDLSIDSGGGEVAVAVRSSATAEDLPTASFAGQLESFLNVSGEQALLDTCRRCFASLFTDRALVYRREHGFQDLDVALSVGVQRMIRSDLGSAGVLFTLDTETGFPGVVLIDGAFGLGESVVQGTVDPDQFVVFKPLLADHRLVPILQKRLGAKRTKVVYGVDGSGTRSVDTESREREAFTLDDQEILTLARWAVAIEEHYGRPMDVEWAKDGRSGEIFIVQARPETVQSRRKMAALRSFRLRESATPLTSGIAIGDAIAAGEVCLLAGAEDIARFRDGCVLVTAVTDPDWVPIMRRAAAIVTDHGGRTSHAAIVSRELGIPAVVGTGDATRVLADGQTITVSCAEGERGRVYEGRLDFEESVLDLSAVPAATTPVMMNIASPESAMRWWRLPASGVGLLRMEYIVNDLIGIHPMALARFDSLADGPDKKRIAELTRGFADRTRYFVDRLARGIATIAASRHPAPVILRLSDFKTNEYARLLGGAAFEPAEENPMLGWRGASRYYGEGYREGFALECRAIRTVREEMGFTNVRVMIPFCRTPAEADAVLAALAENGLRRGENGLEVWVMCEIPSNVILAEEFAQRFDGFSIGSNDLTQLVLGVDRDAARLAHLFDERNEAVKRLLRDVIRRAHRSNRPVGICGQAPSDHPEFVAFLVGLGIDSISVTPDRVVATLQHVAEAERQLERSMLAREIGDESAGSTERGRTSGAGGGAA